MVKLAKTFAGILVSLRCTGSVGGLAVQSAILRAGPTANEKFYKFERQPGWVKRS